MENNDPGSIEPLVGEDGNDVAIPEPTRKRRGRPRNADSNGGGNDGRDGSGDGGSIGIDATIGSGDGNDHGNVEVGKPRRGRKPGRKPKRSAEEVRARLEATAQLVYGAHHVIADMLKAPVLVLQPVEAERLSNALIACADAWDFNPVTDPRVTTSLALLATAFGIYMPRMKALRQMRDEKQQAEIINAHDYAH